MKLAQIEDGIVANVIEVDPFDIPDWCADWPLAEFAEIGGLFDGKEFLPAAAPAVDLEAMRSLASLTFAQLLIGLVTEGWITAAEGEAWLTGVLPAQVTAMIGTLPAEHQFAAKARAIRPSEVLRMDPFVVSMGAAQGKTPEELDQFFRTYSGV